MKKKLYFRTKSCQNELNKWGMQLDNQLIQLEGRALDVEQVLYRDVNI